VPYQPALTPVFLHLGLVLMLGLFIPPYLADCTGRRRNSWEAEMKIGEYNWNLDPLGKHIWRGQMEAGQLLALVRAVKEEAGNSSPCGGRTTAI